MATGVSLVIRDQSLKQSERDRLGICSLCTHAHLAIEEATLDHDLQKRFMH